MHMLNRVDAHSMRKRIIYDGIFLSMQEEYSSILECSYLQIEFESVKLKCKFVDEIHWIIAIFSFSDQTDQFSIIIGFVIRCYD